MSERTHRHQLEKNLLADWLAEKGQALKPYTTQLAVGGLVAVAVLVAAIYYFTRTDTATPRAWQAYFAAFGEPKVADALKDAFEKPEVAGTTAELWALLSYADQRFQLASVQGGQDSQEAKKALADAEQALTEVLEKANNPMLLSRAQFTLARVYESQNKPNKARELYQKLVDAKSDSALGKQAAEAIKRLDPAGETVQVLAWLAEQKPLARPAGGSSPFDSFGPGFGGLGGFGQEPTLPERPNLDLPGSSPFGPGAGGIDFGSDKPGGTKGTEPDTAAPELNAPATDKPESKANDTGAVKSSERKAGDDEPSDERPTSDTSAAPPKDDAKASEAPKDEPAEEQ